MTTQRMSPATLSAYTTSVGQLAAFLAERGMPTSPPDIRREHVEAFVSELLARWKPATTHNRYRALASFSAQMTTAERRLVRGEFDAAARWATARTATT